MSFPPHDYRGPPGGGGAVMYPQHGRKSPVLFTQGPLWHQYFSPSKPLRSNEPPNEAFLRRNINPPKAPEKPLMPYMRFSKKIWEKVRNEQSNNNKSISEVGKQIGQLWRDLPDNEKRVYWQEYELEKQRYDAAMKQYRDSPQYQHYLNEKARQEAQQRLAAERESSQGQMSMRVSILSCEEEDENVSVKGVAEERFHRNHHLMYEVLSDACVPDIRNIVSRRKLLAVRNQVESLEKHHKKLEDDLEELQNLHAERKRKISESSDKFQEEYKKASDNRTDISDAEFDNMVKTFREDLKEKQRQQIILEEQRRIEKQRLDEEAAKKAEQAQEQMQDVSESGLGDGESGTVDVMDVKTSDSAPLSATVIIAAVADSNTTPAAVDVSMDGSDSMHGGLRPAMAASDEAIEQPVSVSFEEMTTKTSSIVVKTVEEMDDDIKEADETLSIKADDEVDDEEDDGDDDEEDDDDVGESSQPEDDESSSQM